MVEEHLLFAINIRELITAGLTAAPGNGKTLMRMMAQMIILG